MIGGRGGKGFYEMGMGDESAGVVKTVMTKRGYWHGELRAFEAHTV